MVSKLAIRQQIGDADARAPVFLTLDREEMAKQVLPQDGLYGVGGGATIGRYLRNFFKAGTIL